MFVFVQVCLYFYNKLYRGNRVTKVDAGSFNAFSSPNLPPLATAEVDIASESHMKGFRPYVKNNTRLQMNMFFVLNVSPFFF